MTELDTEDLYQRIVESGWLLGTVCLLESGISMRQSW